MSNPWDQPKSKSSYLPWIIAIVAIGFAASQVDWKWSAKPDDDRQEQVEPKPAKLEKGSHVIIVEETSERKNFPFIASLQTDRDYWDKLKASGINWGFYDQDSPNVASYEADIKAAGLPALLVISPAGRVLLSKSCPPTTESIDETLRSLK